VTAASFAYPHRALGEAEPVAKRFGLGAGVDDGIEARIVFDDGERAVGWCLAAREGLSPGSRSGRQAQGDDRQCSSHDLVD